MAIVPAVYDDAAGSTAATGDEAVMGQVGASLDAIGAAFGADLPFTVPQSGDVVIDATDERGSGQQVAQDLVDTLFADDNYEGDGYYRLTAELFCPEDPTTGQLDADCVQSFEQVPLWIHVTLVGDAGLDIALAVGDDRVEPAWAELRTASITFVADLAAAKSAVVDIAEALGESTDILPDTFEGVIAAGVTVHARNDVEFAVSVREAVAIAADWDGEHFEVRTAAATPLATVRLDGGAKEITASLDIGETYASFPYESDLGVALGQAVLDWKGLSATATASANGIDITNIGLGDDTSTWKLDDHVLAAVDFNADSGRHADLAIAPVPGQLPTFAFSPGYDLAVTVDLSPLADAGEIVEPYLLGETYRVNLAGDTPTVQPVAASAGSTGGLAVRAGTLTISSTAGGEVVVAEGQCLTSDLVTDGEHPIIGAFAANACP